MPITPACLEDAEALARIYNAYVTDSLVTFEEEPIAASDMAERMRRIASYGTPWLVARGQDEIIGYAYAGPFRSRQAYRHTAETTIYLDPKHTGQGHGTPLYQGLLHELTQRGYTQAIGVIALPNVASENLHAKVGFKRMGILKAVGFKCKQWVDTAYWQRHL